MQLYLLHMLQLRIILKYKKLIYVLLCTIFLIPNDIYISSQYKDIFDIRKKQADISRDYSILSTIKPINISTSYTNGERNKKNSTDMSATISYRQEFFKSGAIWKGIDVANINHKAIYFSIDKDKRNLLYNIFTLSLQIKVLDLEIVKQGYFLKNAIISHRITKENYINGISSITNVDSASIVVNSKDNILNDLKKTKTKSLRAFKNISDIDYKDILIPKLEIPNIDKFIEFNNINNQQETINMKIKNVGITKSRYLPYASLNVKYGYNDNDLIQEISQTNYSVGVSISMNIDIISSSNAIEQAKLSLLLSQSQYMQSKKEQKNLYHQMINQIEIQNTKIKLSKKSSRQYESFVLQVKNLYKSGARTKDDLKVAMNTKKIKIAQIKIAQIRNQINIIELNKQGNFN